MEVYLADNEVVVVWRVLLELVAMELLLVVVLLILLHVADQAVIWI
jgi:hypothetical protein